MKFNLLKSKLAKDSLIYTVTDVVNMAIPFLLLPILTRYLTPGDYGVLNVFTSIVSGISILLSLKTEAAININYYKMDKKELSIYIGNIIMIVSFIFFILLFAIFLTQDFLLEKFALPFIWILLALFLSFANFITIINTNLWIVEQKPALFGSFKISSTIINLVLSIIFVVVLLMSWQGRVLGIITTAILASIVSLFLLFKRNYITFELNKSYLKDALNFSIPLIPYQLSGWIRNGGIIFLLIYLVGKNETGLYSVGSKFALLIYVLSMAFTKAWGPFLYRELSIGLSFEKKKKIVKTTYLSFIFFLLLAFLLTVVSPFIIDIVFPSTYANSYNYVGYLVFGAAFQGMYLMVVKFIYFKKKTKYVAYITFAVASINFLLAYFLINLNGAIGAAQANVISFFLSFVLIWYYSSKVYNLPWNLFKYHGL